MMNTQHTSGTWVAKNANFYPGVKIFSESGLHIADALMPKTKIVGEFRDEMEANARLIAAAPELLEALKQLVQHIEWREDFLIEDADEGEQNAYTLAQAAIDKATK